MALPWGVKQDVDPDSAEEVTSYFTNIDGMELDLPSNNTIKFIKAGVKERKGNYFLILRYQITKRPS